MPLWRSYSAGGAGHSVATGSVLSGLGTVSQQEFRSFLREIDTNMLPSARSRDATISTFTPACFTRPDQSRNLAQHHHPERYPHIGLGHRGRLRERHKVDWSSTWGGRAGAGSVQRMGWTMYGGTASRLLAEIESGPLLLGGKEGVLQPRIGSPIKEAARVFLASST